LVINGAPQIAVNYFYALLPFMDEGDRLPPADPQLGSGIFNSICTFSFPFGFFVLVSWFRVADVYHKHFFDSGWLVAGYNIARIIFIGYLFWLIYATGCIALDRFGNRRRVSTLTTLERIIISGCIGAGIWHVLLLILGVTGLLYWQLMAALALVVLLLSASMFKVFLLGTRTRFRCCLAIPTDANSFTRSLCILLLVSVAVVLLITRGLYPGGGHDYYTHYFYYYHDVVARHTLAPNDVWYHYYYSKGAGLFFFAILLTDPQSPELVTFCFVVLASVGIAAVAVRAAPDTAWPPAAAALYLLFYIVPLAGPPYLNAGPGGEFQKLHELTSACIILAICIACLDGTRTKEGRWSYLTAATSIAITATILTPAVGVLLGIAFMGAAVLMALRKEYASAFFYLVLSLSGYFSGGFTLIQNYLTTGLASDQMIDLMWRWANIERLNTWGVVPMVLITAWIRHNYNESAVPLGLPTVQLLGDYIRWSAIWPFLLSGTVAGIYAQYRLRRHSFTSYSSVRVFLISGGLSACFVVLAILFGRSQIFSFFRLSSFFFPLVVIVSLSGWASLTNSLPTRWTHHSPFPFVPIIVLIGLPILWIPTYDWVGQISAVTRYSAKFLIGDFSLATAYSHQAKRDAVTYGAIHPGALEAARQVGFGVPIWSMHIHTYCMVPECRIESVVSFKMSRHYNDILNGAPDKAAALLKKEGLNYFLISKDLPLVDLLPYSNLFSPDNIAKHLAVRWTDGTTYLLTWPDETTRPIPPELSDFYRQMVEAGKQGGFNFDQFIPQLGEAMNVLEQSPHPWKPIQLPWRSTEGITSE
jgi:hypothetical protein